MSGDKTKVNLVMDVYPNAPAGAMFSDQVLYAFHLNSAATFGGTATETKIFCGFDTAQKITCWVGGTESLTGDASATTGISSTSGKTKVFAGLRDDPFFFNLTGFKATAADVIAAATTPGLLTFDPSGCPMLDSATSTALVGQLVARRHYDDVSPFAVAWLEFQEGHMWESAGRSDRARPLFESALSRLPGYAAAAGHLAHLLAAFDDPAGRERARALLEPLVTRTDDPEYVGQLGALYRQMQRTADGDRLIEQARRSYEALIARHPAAFYDHAARFYLHVGGNPRRALDFARGNLAIRQTPDARDLVAEAELASLQTASVSR
jgi:tetratricopeptide (TPR) repeat protein